LTYDHTADDRFSTTPRDVIFTLVSDAKFMAEHSPNSTLVVVEGAGHMPNLERDPEFNTALGRLLDSVR
jgi:pimeloyl-ACP methyl ester carboxylesterase